MNPLMYMCVSVRVATLGLQTVCRGDERWSHRALSFPTDSSHVPQDSAFNCPWNTFIQSHWRNGIKESEQCWGCESISYTAAMNQFSFLFRSYFFYKMISQMVLLSWRKIHFEVGWKSIVKQIFSKHVPSITVNKVTFAGLTKTKKVCWRQRTNLNLYVPDQANQFTETRMFTCSLQYYLNITSSGYGLVSFWFMVAVNALICCILIHSVWQVSSFIPQISSISHIQCLATSWGFQFNDFNNMHE